MADSSIPIAANGLDEKQQQVLDHQRNGLPTDQKSRTIFHYATPLDFVILAISSLAAIIAGVFNPTLAIFYGQLAGNFSGYQKGTVSSSQLQAKTTKFSLLWVYLGIETFIAVYISTTGFYYTGERITRRLREAYLKTTIRQNVAFFDTLGAGELTTRITSDINLIQEGLTRSPTVFLTAAATLSSAFVIAYIQYWKLALILSSTLVLMAIIGAVGVAYPVRWTKQSLALYGSGATVVEEAIGSIRHVTAFGIQDSLVERYDTYLKRAERPALKGGIGTALALSVMEAVPFFTFGLAFWEGSRLLLRGEISTAAVVSSTLAIILGTWTIDLLAPNAKATLSSIASASSILKSMCRQSPEDPFSKQGKRLENSGLDITFRDVGLIYPSRPDITVLKQLKLTFPAFKTTAIVGASGCGKSSIIGLLERFYKPTEGEILFGHDDIQTLNLNWLRSQLSLVGQEPTLFRTTVFQNIVYGLDDANISRPADELKALVQQAAITANAHDFILRLEKGYDTEIGEKGMLLSGGQRQRICIARAIIKNPQILLLDEATSALDVEAERLVQKALARAAKGRTTVVIAHRLSTVRDADNIIVMSDGQVVEQGTHEELIAEQGRYAELVQKQKFSNKPIGPDITTDVVSNKSDSDMFLEKERIDFLDEPIKQDESRKEEATVPKAEPKRSSLSTHGLSTALSLVMEINRPEMLFFIPAAFLAVLVGLSVPAQSLIFAKVMNALSLRSGDDLRNRIDFWSLMFLVLGLGVFVTWLGHSISFAYTEEKLVHRTRYRSFKHILRQDVGFFDQEQNSIGPLTSLVSSASNDLNGLGVSVIGASLTFLATILGGIVLSLAIAWKLALVCLATVPLVAGFGWVRLAALTLFGQKIKQTHQDSAAYASEVVSAIRTVASLNMEARVMKHYNSILSQRSKESIRSILVASAYYAASYSITHFCAALAFWYGGTLIANDHYSVFQFFVCFAALISGTQAAGILLSSATGMSKAIGAAGDLKTLFERRPEIDSWDTTSKETLVETPAGKIEFRNVSFSYASRKERSVLDNINITIKPGQYIALIGPSGCGKSTMIALLERFYDPTSGQILVDGQDISKLNVNEYRRHLSLVGQEQTLYSGTIRENLALGASSNVSEEEILQACREANIYDFIMSLPNGFSTEVGSKGVMLSGGQRQRMAIARAILRNTTILLLDEATAALDATSEKMVQDAIDKAVKKRTTIAVAHRLSTIQNADVIYVLKDGRIVEVGNHHDLMGKERGVYRGLVEMQSLDEAAREM